MKCLFSFPCTRLSAIPLQRIAFKCILFGRFFHCILPGVKWCNYVNDQMHLRYTQRWACVCAWKLYFQCLCNMVNIDWLLDCCSLKLLFCLDLLFFFLLFLLLISAMPIALLCFAMYEQNDSEKCWETERQTRKRRKMLCYVRL